MNVTFPKFTSSDKELDITYNYRAELYNKHVKTVPSGYVVSEFLPDVPWAGIYNTISCAAMHHFRDGRWMDHPEVLEDYARFWCTEGNPRLYSFPIADSVLALSRVTGSYSTAETLYPEFCRILSEWDDHKTESGMYRQTCNRDGMEFSISGDGIRPTINSYMHADMLALSTIAKRIGNEDDAQKFRNSAEELKSLINEKLWNPELGIYCIISDTGAMQNVKELIGYIPWIFGVAPNERAGCFRYLIDPDCFLSKHGLRTADASHPDYMKSFTHECLWNGPIWPFATAQTLSAVIAYLQSESDPVIKPKDFMDLLLTYARSHRDTDGTPWLDENMHPDTGIWLAREILRERNRKDKERGQHYNHSTFIDLVMTGIVGICPADGDRLTIRPLGTSLEHFTAQGISYHSHKLNVKWRRGAGLYVTVDGEKEYFCPDCANVMLEISL